MKSIALAFAAAAGLLMAVPSAGPAWSQTGAVPRADDPPQTQLPELYESTPLQEQQAPSLMPQFSEGELKSYAVAALMVQHIDETYQSAFMETEDEEERRSIAAEAEDRMTQAVADEGLSVEKYNDITMAAQARPDIAAQIIAFMLEKVK